MQFALDLAQHSHRLVNKLSLELILLQAILPALLEQSLSLIWLKWLARLWCSFMACSPVLPGPALLPAGRCGASGAAGTGRLSPRCCRWCHGRQHLFCVSQISVF